MNRRRFLRSVIIAAAAASTPTMVNVAFKVMYEDPKVRALLDRLPWATSEQKRAIAQFVYSQIKNGNWEQLDAFYLPGFSGNTNWII